MQTKQKELLPVSVVIPMRNSKTTVLLTLKSIISQTYPASEIIVVDNASSDDSVGIVEGFAKTSKIPIRVIKRSKNKGVGASYNFGVKKTSSKLVIFMHSDSSLPTKHEIAKLVAPLLANETIVATFPRVILPEEVWNSYTFWQKCLFARAVGKESPGFNGKFDSIRKKTFTKVGGFDDVNYGEDVGVGGEDGDLYLRLAKEGSVVLSEARVIHLHYLGKNYAINNWIKNRKLLGRTNGRLLRLQGLSLPIRTSGVGLKIPLGALLFMVKPTLAILPFLPGFHVIGILLAFLYAFLNSRKMYMSPLTRKDRRILLLPFLDIFLLYYESFWMFQAFFFMKNKTDDTKLIPVAN